MIFVDLTDTTYVFNCSNSRDMCEYWEYNFSIECMGDKHSWDLSKGELEKLRNNCMKILHATENIQEGESYEL